MSFTFFSSLSQTFYIQSINHVMKKLYMIVDDFYVMFHEKKIQKNINIIQTNLFSSFSRQIHIIAYFKLVTHSINHKLTTSKFFFSKRLHFIFASIFISRSNFFCFFYICRFCHATFTYNNDLHRHFRTNHLREKFEKF